jgi:hypothetical protein
VVKTTADGAVLEMRFAGNKTTGNNPAAALGGAFAEKLKDVTFRITLSKSGQVTKFEGFDDFVKAVVGDNEVGAKTVRSMGLEELFTQGVTLTFGFLPTKEVAKGDKWKQTGTMPIPLFGALKSETEFVYQGPGAKGDEITFAGTFTYEVPKPMAQTLLKVTKGDVKVEPSKGTIVFDPATGRLVRLERPFKLKGTFTVDGGGKEQTLEMEQDSTTTVRVLKENPLK